MAATLVLIVSCGGRAESCEDCSSDIGPSDPVGTSAGGGGGSQVGTGGSTLGTGGSTLGTGGSTLGTGGNFGFGNPPMTLQEADAQLAARLQAEGHGHLIDGYPPTYGDACYGLATECETPPGGIEFVVDRGKGMARSAEENSPVVHFDRVREMLQSVVDDLLDNSQVGLSFVPPLDAGECDFSSPSVPRTNLDEELRMLLQRTLTEAKPTQTEPVALIDAYRAAVARLESDRHGGAVVLVTEGETEREDGCVPFTEYSPHLDPDLWTAVQEAGDSGIATLVVGAPGSSSISSGQDARPFLSQLATVAGGLLCDPLAGAEYRHFDMTATAPVAPLVAQALRSFHTCWLPFEFHIWNTDTNVVESHFVVQTWGGVFELSGGRGNECGVGYEEDDEIATICPETYAELACLGPTGAYWAGICSD